MEIIKYAYYGLGTSNTYFALKKHLEENGFDMQDDLTFINESKKRQALLVSCKDISEVKKSLKTNKVDFALIPIVNSDSGIVPFSSKMMFEENFEVTKIITDEVLLSLYGLEDIQDYSKVKGIISNLPALSQCSNFVNRNMPFAVFYKASSTTEAVKMMIERNDPSVICIANQSAQEDSRIHKLSTSIKGNIVSNNGETETKYLLIKRREEMKMPKNINKIFPGYYVYQSRNLAQSLSSVSPASWRVVEIKKNKYSFDIRGFVFGFTCDELFKSNTTAMVKEDKDNYTFFYEYDNKHEDGTVDGIAKLAINIPMLINSNRIKGMYCGNGNKKAGTLEFHKISKKEFDIYLEGLYEKK